MLSTFNPFYQTLRGFLFKNYDPHFNQCCTKLKDDTEDLFCVIDGRGNAKFIKERSMQILGKSINAKYTFIFFEMYGSYIKNLFKKGEIFSHEKLMYIEFPMKDINNKYVWLRLSFRPVILDGEFLIAVIAKDVTKKRALLDQFGENNLWSKSIVENIKLGVIIEDANRNIVSVNKKFMEIFKLEADPNDFVGANCGEAAEHLKDLFTEPAAFVQSNNKIIAEKKDVIDEILKLTNGQIVERSFFRFTTNTDDVMCYWIYNDVTEYHRLINLISSEEAKYREIIENTKLGILESDSTGIITHASNIFCKMVGYEKEQLEGIDVKNGLLMDESALEHFIDLVRNNLPGSNQNNAFEFQINTREGTKLWVLVSVAVSFNNKNEITGYTGFYYDNTERKALEQSLILANEASKKAEENEKLFLANMTHELKTPINAILGMGDLLKLTRLDTEQKEYVEILDISTKYLQKLVSDVLDTSRLEAGHVEIRKDPFNLMELVVQIAHSFDYSLAKNNLALKINFHFCPTLEILGDRTLLQQVLSNLLSNAEKFTHQGSITLLVETIEETKNHVKLKFEVKDTGVGFDENLKDLIFEKFTQLPSQSQHKSPGSGLGLSIVKKLLAYHGSSIQVKSTVDKGSEFSFDLTFEKNIVTETLIPVLKNRDFDAPFKDLSVLVVEDNDLNIQYITKVLNKWSVNFDLVTSGESALENFSQKEYNLVLLDIQLPGINGFETAKRLRKLFDTHVYTIVAMTAVVTHNAEQEVFESGMNGIVKKPFSVDELYDKIASFFLTGKKKPSIGVPFYDPSGIDFFKKFYGNDHEFALSVFEKFRDYYLNEFRTIITAADELPQDEIDFRLHSIKPSFKMVGLVDIEEEINEYITLGPKTPNELTKRFTEAKIANAGMILDMQIGMLKQIVSK